MRPVSPVCKAWATPTLIRGRENNRGRLGLDRECFDQGASLLRSLGRVEIDMATVGSFDRLRLHDTLTISARNHLMVEQN